MGQPTEVFGTADMVSFMKVVRKDKTKQSEYYKVVGGKTIKISEEEYFASNKET